MLADGAMPIVPHTAGPEVGQDVAEQVRADDDVEPVRMQDELRASGCRCGTGRCGSPGYCAAIALKRSSQYGIVIEMPFDLVAEVTCFARARPRQLEREPQDAVDALAGEHRSAGPRSRARCLRTCGRRPTSIRPRCSRARRRSRCRRACGSASGVGMPGISRHGRRLTYWSNRRRNWISEPQSETWSGTVAGQPTAPKKIASCAAICANQSSGIMRPCLRVVVAAPVGNSSQLESMPNLRRRGLEHAQAFRNDFLADAVAGNDGNAMRAGHDACAYEVLAHSVT